MRSVVLGGFLVAVPVAIVGGFLWVVWREGGLDTSGRYLDWEVVAALATVLAAVGALAALGTIGFNLHQLNAARRSERLSFMPYLRVDVAFEERRARHSGFTPPPTRYMFEAEDFAESVDVGDLGVLKPKSGREHVTLCLWVTNEQTAALGHAYRIQIHLVLGWQNTGGDRKRDPEAAVVHAAFAYLEPGKTTGVRLAKVRPDIAWVAASVTQVSYYSMYADRKFRTRHGAMTTYYSPVGGAWNDREARFRERGRLREFLTQSIRRLGHGVQDDGETAY